MKIKFLLVSVLMCLAASVSAQDIKAEKKIAELGATDNQTWNYLSTMTSRFGGRLLGSAAYEATAEWMLAEFKKLGIEAHLEEGGTVPVGFDNRRNELRYLVLVGCVQINCKFRHTV